MVEVELEIVEDEFQMRIYLRQGGQIFGWRYFFVLDLLLSVGASVFQADVVEVRSM